MPPVGVDPQIDPSPVRGRQRRADEGIGPYGALTHGVHRRGDPRGRPAARRRFHGFAPARSQNVGAGRRATTRVAPTVTNFKIKTDETITADSEDYVDLSALVSKTNAL